VHGSVGTDYVLIGRKEKTDARNFQDLLEDLRTALVKAPQKQAKL
jgi:hypothetical protein